MSFYFLIFLLLAAGTLIEWFLPRYKEITYWICWTITGICVCFRYGQGVDYITYHAIYETIPTVIDLSQGYICGFFPETGWRLLSAAFKVMNIPFWIFAMLLGMTEMLLLHRFFKKYLSLKTMGLFMSYPVLFLAYMISGLRQGLAMCIFLGILVPFYMEKKWIRYVLGALIAASFHKVGYMWLILPAVYYLPVWLMTALTGAAFVIGLVLQIGFVQQMLSGLIPSYHVNKFLMGGDISFFALAERIVSLGVLFFLYQWCKRRSGTADKQSGLLLKAYMCNVFFYVMMFGNAYYASRFGAIFKILECAVLASLIKDRDFITKLSALFFFCLTMLMGIKNMNAIIQQTYYYDPAVVKVWNIPYVSVFNKDDINKYYPYEERLQEVYDGNIEDQQLWMIED